MQKFWGENSKESSAKFPFPKTVRNTMQNFWGENCKESSAKLSDQIPARRFCPAKTVKNQVQDSQTKFLPADSAQKKYT